MWHHNVSTEMFLLKSYTTAYDIILGMFISRRYFAVISRFIRGLTLESVLQPETETCLFGQITKVIGQMCPRALDFAPRKSNSSRLSSKFSFPLLTEMLVFIISHND